MRALLENQLENIKTQLEKTNDNLFLLQATIFSLSPLQVFTRYKIKREIKSLEDRRYRLRQSYNISLRELTSLTLKGF